MLENLQDFVADAPAALQWLAVILLGAIPFVESYSGSAIGVVVGLNPIVAVTAAIVGNILTMIAFVVFADRVRARVRRDQAVEELSPRREKLKRRFDRYGVAGVSLLGQLVLPSQITSALIVSFGASRRAVIVWQIISIILWGIAFGALATAGVALLSAR